MSPTAPPGVPAGGLSLARRQEQGHKGRPFPFAEAWVASRASRGRVLGFACGPHQPLDSLSAQRNNTLKHSEANCPYRSRISEDENCTSYHNSNNDAHRRETQMLGKLEADHYRQKYAFQIQKLVGTLETRLLPTFDGLKAEVEAMTKDRTQEYEDDAQLKSWLDSGQAHEAIFAAAMEHYDMGLSIRQGLHNMFAAWLFHLFEQQVQEFHVKALYQPRMRYAHEVLSLWDTGLSKDIRTPHERNTLDELRELANTVKHGDGRAAATLYTLNPVLFQNEWDRQLPPDFGVITHKPSIFTPGYGEDIYVQLCDIHRYRQVLLSVWNSYLNAFCRDE